MKRYDVGPRFEYFNGDTEPRDTERFSCEIINAETSPEARRKYKENNPGYTGKVMARFICKVNSLI